MQPTKVSEASLPMKEQSFPANDCGGRNGRRQATSSERAWWANGMVWLKSIARLRDALHQHKFRLQDPTR
jgi:hypothetical protein